MEDKVLIVGPGSYLTKVVEQGLGKRRHGFEVLTATNGKTAIQLLKAEAISVLVSEFNIPKARDISFINYITEYFPDVDLIVVGGLTSQEFRKLVNTESTVEYIRKPYKPDTIVTKIEEVLDRQVDGGVLHNVSSGIFLQLIQMEQRTCTIRIMDNATRKKGVLFFKDGVLLDGRSSGLQGESAAYEIFSWDYVSIWIQNSCCQTQKKINSELQAVLLEALRRKDEVEAKKPSAQQEAEEIFEPEEVLETEEADGTDTVGRIRELLEKESGHGFDVIDIYEDTAWDSLLAQASRIGAFFEAGELKVAYVDGGELNDYLLVPEEQTIVLVVDPKCPRDRLMKLLIPSD